jgi:hypothetical protein
MAVNGLRGEGYAHRIYEPWDIQDLQHWQDQTNATVMVLESNAKIVKTLRSFYESLVARDDFPNTLKKACEDDMYAFFSQLDEIISDFDMQITRAKLLANIISDRKELVLQHLQSQASERTEQLNKNLEREAILMRIVTIVTLLYLPATFVSTFFSTDVVKYQDQDRNASGYEKASFSSLALERWLQVTIPLTFLTLFGAWLTYHLCQSTMGRPKFPESLKCIVPRLASPRTDSLTSRTVRADPAAKTSKDAIDRLVRPIKEFARGMHGFRNDRAILPTNEEYALRTG